MTTARQTDLHVALVEAEIHWNTGNAGRTCLAAGAQLHLIEPLGFSLEEKQVRRAGLDYWPRVDPSLWSSWKAFEKEMESLGQPYFFSPTARRTVWDADFTAPSILVFGPETRGLSSRILSGREEQTLLIPQLPNTVRSLNLSTCVAIALYEALRQRR